ncbi:hypothetical protein Syun_005989 [Stephania yunnanensis]|uniref:Uncharacterized protein n=1 Tax=Stephania yunnanensis TaxID=152371 RepID=A0AAP0KX83_9MAGN
MEGGGNCFNGKLDDSGYSSPVPLIGLYIAGGTLVCLLFILLDVIAGFRNRKRWIPCRFFPLNSVTLTLLSVAVKLPLDLTTSMPSALDQLSKLTGTSLLCICMAFFLPSLGLNTYSDCFTNMVALTIFVVTVVVNVCIQMHTGVIFLFRVQHIIILCCIIVLLIVLWHCAFDIHSQNEANIKAIKGKFTKGENNIFRGLKKCFLLSYNLNPQFMLCRNVVSNLVAALCAICSVLLLKVSFQSLVSKKLESCEGLVSDYKWSVRPIVVSQIITILAGAFIGIFRALTWLGHFDLKADSVIGKEAGDEEYIILRSSILFMSSLDYLAAAVKLGLRTIFKWISSFISVLIMLLYFCLEGCIALAKLCFCNVCKTNDENGKNNGEDLKEFKDLTHNELELRLVWWTLEKGVEDMKKFIHNGKTSSELAQLLSKTPLTSFPHEALISMLKNHYNSARPGYQTSSLSIVLLVRIAAISIPSSLSESLLKAFSEVFEIVYFVDRQMSSSQLGHEENFKLAKSLWESRNFNKLLLSKIVKTIGKEAFETRSHLDQAIMVIQGLYEAMPSDYVWEELKLVTEFIQRSTQAHGSVEELYCCMEQLFVAMATEFLIQLPNAIFKYISESPVEEFEERVKCSLKLISNMEQLEGLVQWSFPLGTAISHFISNEVPALDGDMLESGTGNTGTLSSTSTTRNEITREDV